MVTVSAGDDDDSHGRWRQTFDVPITGLTVIHTSMTHWQPIVNNARAIAQVSTELENFQNLPHIANAGDIILNQIQAVNNSIANIDKNIAKSSAKRLPTSTTTSQTSPTP